MRGLTIGPISSSRKETVGAWSALALRGQKSRPRSKRPNNRRCLMSRSASACSAVAHLGEERRDRQRDLASLPSGGGKCGQPDPEFDDPAAGGGPPPESRPHQSLRPLARDHQADEQPPPLDPHIPQGPDRRPHPAAPLPGGARSRPAARPRGPAFARGRRSGRHCRRSRRQRHPRHHVALRLPDLLQRA
jgi:hypothetical protein